MKLKVKRIFYGPEYTIGKMYIDGVFFCDTLEDTNRDLNRNGKFDNGEVKVKGKTCIPFGTYKVVLAPSPRFKRELPRLLNVPSFDGVLIHAGNTASDTEGCILIGDNSQKGKVLNSRLHETELVNRMRSSLHEGSSFEITIE